MSQAIIPALLFGTITYGAITVVGWLIQKLLHHKHSAYHWVALVIAVLVAIYQYLEYLGR